MLYGIIRKEDGYTLPFILFISILAATLLLSLISTVYFKNIIEIGQLNKKKLELACFSAVQEHVASIKEYKSGEYYLQTDSISVLITHCMKGLFYEVTATARRMKDSSKVHYLFAEKVTPPFDNALIISRQNLQAAIAGNTYITGNILATSPRITRGNIFGISSFRNEFLSGKIKTDSKIKTKLFDEAFLKSLRQKRLTEEGFRYFDDLEINNTDIPDTLRRLYVRGNLSFGGVIKAKSISESKTIIVNGIAAIRKYSFTDLPVELFCDSTVIIEENSVVENIIIYAEKIEVKQKAKLTNVQLIATENIKIDNSVLLYPSVVLLYLDTSSPASLRSTIDINSSTVNGSVMLINTVSGMGNNKSKIIVDGQSKVNGLLYSENNVEVSGKVTGIIYTCNFWFYKSPTEYINWLVNVEVNREELSKWFLLPPGLSGEINPEILKETWIY